MFYVNNLCFLYSILNYSSLTVGKCVVQLQFIFELPIRHFYRHVIKMLLAHVY